MIVMKKVYDLITNSWVEIPEETDSSKVEHVKLNREKVRAIGLYSGSKLKAFSDMSDDEQKLFGELEKGDKGVDIKE